MGVTWTPLILIQPNLADGTRVAFPQLPHGVTPRIEEGSRTLDAGLLVGEKLGLDLSKLSECLNEVWFAPQHRGRGLFNDDDIPILIDGYTQIRDTLRVAIDEHGRPVGTGGERLKASQSIEQYWDGSMVTRLRRVRLVDLLGSLDELLRFLLFARDHGLYMSDGFLSAPDAVEHEEKQSRGPPDDKDEDGRA